MGLLQQAAEHEAIESEWRRLNKFGLAIADAHGHGQGQGKIQLPRDPRARFDPDLHQVLDLLDCGRPGAA